MQRILPALSKECVNTDMIPFVLPSVLLMAEQATDKEYMAFIFPELKPMFKIKEPIQVIISLSVCAAHCLTDGRQAIDKECIAFIFLELKPMVKIKEPIQVILS